MNADGQRRTTAHTCGPSKVGCYVLKSDAPSGHEFVRRAFWVKDYDRSEQPDGMYKTSAPREAVDPRTVRAGSMGRSSARLIGQSGGRRGPHDEEGCRSGPGEPTARRGGLFCGRMPRRDLRRDEPGVGSYRTRTILTSLTPASARL
ncbi:DUF6009 family protein [Streptomyces sp. BpilaLS-43]|uniref:DUF6009 family protein n=1 Tax=Streptomyces sp. BpilaLS-43 TaxID=1839778 RepID=UPI00351E20B0